MLFTDILHIALRLQEQQALCKGDRNHKKVISSQRAGVKALQLIFFGCIQPHKPDLIKNVSVMTSFYLGNYEKYLSTRLRIETEEQVKQSGSGVNEMSLYSYY